jgi:hypothetical protein
VAVNLTLPEALAVMCTYVSHTMAMGPGDREMLEAAARVVGDSASGTRERFREATKEGAR